ncbi:MAG: UpxY family transcription antiterminator [Leptospiraceae bacterium]|nr:UpxY family transcription antiterminator [Leptospiraceae bacterium]
MSQTQLELIQDHLDPDQAWERLQEHNDPEVKDWFALYTKARAEKKLALALTRLGIEHYLPLVSEKRQWSDRKKIIETPLFKSYIFIHINYIKERVRALQAQGTVHMVRSEGQPVVLVPRVIENIRLLVDHAESLRVDPYQGFIEGTPVRVRSGTFKGLTGIVDKVNSRSTVYVVLKGIGQVLSAKLDPMDLELEDL